MRICHLGKYYPPAHGGIETHTQTLARAQAELGCDVRVYCMNHEPGGTVEDVDGPIAITRFGRAASAARLDYCPDLKPALDRLEVDLIHVQVPNPTMLLAILASKIRVPIVVGYQSDLVGKKLRGLLFRPLERMVYRRVHAIMPNNPTYLAGSSFLNAYRDRLRVLPLGIDLDPYVHPSIEHIAAADRIRSEHPGPLWLGCGRLVCYKGFINAIRALTRVPGTLLLIGKGPDRAALEAEALRIGVADRVKFLGGLPHHLDIIPYYLAADAFWFPSNARSESFGLVQVEAMACGCPVINAAIPHSGVPWVSPHQVSGLTVPVDNPVALADAANRLLNEPGLRDRLAAGGRSRARDEFDHRVMARRSLAIYRDVLDGKAISPKRRDDQTTDRSAAGTEFPTRALATRS